MGLVARPRAIWVNDNGSGLLASYGFAGEATSVAIHVPAPTGTGAGAPTGLVYNLTDAFTVTMSSTVAMRSSFLISTEDGTIAAWNSTLTSSAAVLAVNNSSSGAVYKGLAVARNSKGAAQIYAANFYAGAIDVFDANFHLVKSFTDTTLPANYAPFNITAIGGRLWVTFALQRLPDKHDDVAGPGHGYIDIFDTDGNFVKRFVSSGALNSPWGMAVAPGHFGDFSHALLVGNFGDGKINAYDLDTGNLLGHLTLPNGNDVVISGLWAIAILNGEHSESGEAADTDGHGEGMEASDDKRLYFTAGINEEAHGLLGTLTPMAKAKSKDN
ncbi:MAG TPA: TIGR03118 family protein [Opitutaceae bacterium]|nr:TIGR03118 family protein [Opitutaceae bacterium]